MFPAATVFVNLMNAYDKPEIMPEMKQLAEYAKQKVPEEHAKVNRTKICRISISIYIHVLNRDFYNSIIDCKGES